MTDVLGDIRRSIAGTLTEGGVVAGDNWPSRATPFSVVVVAGLPYISIGSPGEHPFGSAVVNHRVVIIGGRGTVDVQSEKLGALVMQCLSALGGQWDEVSDFYITEAPGLGEVLACDISVPTVIQIPPKEVP